MSVKFPNLSWWLWSGKKKDAKLHKRSSIKSSPKLNMMEVDMVKLPVVNGTEKVRRKRRCYEEGKIDKELNVVLLSSDGGCSYDSESDSSDWSIGWSEPHAPGFLSEDEIDGGFGVLVRCYGNFSGSKQDHGKDVPDGTANVPALYSADSKKYMEQWLSSLQGN